ncbi:hypothetical protein AGABI1DRAFT_118238 [Agaricus bisporus var. burnettii JB137-S8]|uniref:Uncharacterized protein n=2 Tax=Agaricus bisporus var. burnettii TaxID=192524 RepID=K5Y465_AGABU|nr:uncharacterized protein AGABI1DRAFT_118238 [Agaricus bisporus var. burnettii JB137-S8]EKM82805.1 hypothetical protein AGABI1DRAFT_118238 [Agaricus bisporus var. burnettii JB137-S8]KAF7778843.1 hypothetical protein Agabi119p4_3188 [Agaricus bisporus var. burnettii]
MSFIHENPVLVAPRPIRLAAAAASHHSIFARPNPIRLLSPAAERAVDRSPDTDDTRLSAENSPRPSPRSGLPSEALEEFLSILRPSMFPPNSPRRRTANTVPPWHYERSTVNLKSWARLEGAPMKNETDDLDLPRFANDGFSPAPVGTITEQGLTDGDSLMDGDNASFRWFSSNVLSSPVSRMHTRNPFLRHAALQSPTPVVPLSPAAIPLPTPTPDELLDLH